MGAVKEMFFKEMTEGAYENFINLDGQDYDLLMAAIQTFNLNIPKSGSFINDIFSFEKDTPERIFEALKNDQISVQAAAWLAYQGKINRPVEAVIDYLFEGATKEKYYGFIDGAKVFRGHTWYPELVEEIGRRWFSIYGDEFNVVDEIEYLLESWEDIDN